MKLPVIQTPEYIIYVEDVDGLAFIHMDVHRWTKESRKRFLKDWNEWADGKELYAMPFIDDDKMAKWSRITGFEILEHHRCTDGKVRKLYWRKQHG